MTNTPLILILHTTNLTDLAVTILLEVPSRTCLPSRSYFSKYPGVTFILFLQHSLSRGYIKRNLYVTQLVLCLDIQRAIDEKKPNSFQLT